VPQKILSCLRSQGEVTVRQSPQRELRRGRFVRNMDTNYDKIVSSHEKREAEMGVNISRVVDTILKERTTVYSPLIEAIVNSIEAIVETNRPDGKVVITPVRMSQASLDDTALPDVIGFIVEDNGIGFNPLNREAFDTLCTDYKIGMGGQGVGRLIFLKYFSKARFTSVYKSNGAYHLREFNLGSRYNFIESERDHQISASDTKTILFLEGLKQHDYDKELQKIAKKVLERILVFFIDDTSRCPTIIFKEDDNEIVLNDLIGENREIQHIHSESFSLKGFTSGQVEESNDFQVRIYKIIYPGTRVSRLCLTAHGRQVTETSLSRYIPEFRDDFVEVDGKTSKNYIIIAYVLGEYLNAHVSFDRGKFNFPSEGTDIVYPLSQNAIEKQSANFVEKVFKGEVQTRRQKRYKAVKKYIDESAPWYKAYLKDLDWSSLPSDLDEQAMESALQHVKFEKENFAKSELRKIIDSPKIELFAQANKLVKSVHEAGKSELTHYVALRKIVLDLLKRLLEIKDDGKYNKEKDIHDIIFPQKSDSESTDYIGHNLWILDERLNFTEYVSSDKEMSKEEKDRPDLLVFNRRMAYRSGDEASNPITIFEFKQPQRDDFVNPSSEEDPVDQTIRYVLGIKERKYKTPAGRDIYVDDNTPFCGYVVCDFTAKVRDWLYDNKNFTPMPDGLGYFQWFPNIRLYMEVLAWDKILKDSEQRNRIFFKKLGLA